MGKADIKIDSSNDRLSVTVSVPKTFPIIHIPFIIGFLLLSIVLFYYSYTKLFFVTLGLLTLVSKMWISSVYSPNKETIFIQHGKGVEVRTESTIISSADIQMIPQSVICDVIIHEQIQVFNVVNFLAFSFKQDGVLYSTKFPPLRPIFSNFELNIQQKQQIYRAIHSYLHSSS
ncbi:hypothetical protein EIN_496700 [Entamoeba invadens IP1]|uniref:Phosphatidylinositol N-acetylglucosaminyltransferase subunit H conserved domain-containing protein n=1 Tax=Entamoeba invadens IP1 TaxID=370355 RepID=A0A0A1U341_ENTIV|nr:hypothetical protein EIN_496700 [Entamoeba invadens IP1]ELP87125.1 hypothetical protein EIN_496700 [Entamoeba invadens IP1]|eukprot:XP_004253896.1 hypothetical protein EIN_496700 [Entamoeba invadens IP1]